MGMVAQRKPAGVDLESPASSEASGSGEASSTTSCTKSAFPEGAEESGRLSAIDAAAGGGVRAVEAATIGTTGSGAEAEELVPFEPGRVEGPSAAESTVTE
ncbi:hypothetical protein V6N13_051257 [Hibiscus sabdariffa]